MSFKLPLHTKLCFKW